MSGEKKVSEKELARAFNSASEKTKGRPAKKKKWPIVVFVLGMIALAVGVAMLIVKLVNQNPVADTEYLVTASEWVREDQPSVVWDFDNEGKGKLTTDGGQNHYDFTWALSGDKMSIKTKWLYDLNDEFQYKIDKNAGTLTIINNDKNVEITFKRNSKE